MTDFEKSEIKKAERRKVLFILLIIILIILLLYLIFWDKIAWLFEPIADDYIHNDP